MKKLTLLLSAMLLACATNLWAGTITLDKLGTNVGATSNTKVATTNIAATETGLGTFTLNYLQGKKQGDAILLAKSTGAFISNKTPIPGAIKSVEVFINSGASAKTTYHCAFGTSEFTEADATGSTEVKISGGSSHTYTCSVANAKFFCISLGNENNGQVLKVVVTYDAAALTSIEIAGEPTKKDYMAGDAFSTDGLKVMGTYEGDDTQKEITSGITWSVTPATLTAGETSVKVTATVGEKTATRTIEGLTVTAAKTLTSIAVSGTPAEFWKGDTFNHEGITVTANWGDNTTSDVTAEATFSEPDMATAGVKTITVTYKDKTATYDITVKTIANTQETAYTTTQAIALIDAGKDLTANVYVKGTISQIDGYSSKTITYWMDANTFMVFRGKGLAGEDFTAVDNVVKGAEVIVYGQIAKFGSTYEFITGNYLASYKAPDVVKQDPTLTLGTYKTSMDANEVNDEYSVTYDGNGTLSVTSSNEEVAMVTIDGTNIVVDALTEGTTTITISATETDTYYFVEKKYTLTVYPAWVAASLPFTFDGGKNSITPKNGIKQSGLGSDYDSSPKLKFGETGASLIIWFNETAASVSYSIKGNPSQNTWSGTFDVLESEDNQKYDTLATHDNLTTTKLTETKTLSSSTRYIKFVYSNKVRGNVALGAIKIVKPSTPSAIDNAVVETPAVKTIENGQLVILRDGKKYNAMGVRLQ